MEQSGLNSIHDGKQATAGNHEADTTFHLDSATIIYNPNGTISGGANYEPSGDTPTSSGGTIIYRPPDTVITPGGQVAHPGQPAHPQQPGAAPQPGVAAWSSAPDQLPGAQRPTIGSPQYGNYYWNQPGQGVTQHKLDHVASTLSVDENPDRFYGIYSLGGVPLPLPLGVIGGSLLGSGAAPYWLDNKYARPVNEDAFLSKTDTELRAEGRSGEQLIRLRNELKALRDADAPFVQQRQLLRQIDNLSGPGGYIGNWWRRFHSPLLSETDLLRSQIDPMDDAITNFKKELKTAAADEDEARAASEKANKLLTGFAEPGAAGTNLDKLLKWASRPESLNLTDEEVLEKKGLLGQALVQKQRLMRVRESLTADPDQAALLFGKFDPTFQHWLRNRTATPDHEVPPVGMDDENVVQAKIKLLSDLDTKLASSGTIDDWKKLVGDWNSRIAGATVTAVQPYDTDHFLSEREKAMLTGGEWAGKPVVGVIPARDNLFNATTQKNMWAGRIIEKSQGVSQRKQEIETLQKPERRGFVWNDHLPNRLPGGGLDTEHLVATGPRYFFKVEGTQDQSGRITAGSRPIAEFTKTGATSALESKWLGWSGDNVYRRVGQGLGVVALGIGVDAVADSLFNGGSPTDRPRLVQSAEGPLAAAVLLSGFNPVVKGSLFVGSIVGAKYLDHMLFPNGTPATYSDVFKPTTVQGFAMGLGWALPFRAEEKYARIGAIAAGWLLGGPVTNLAVTGIERLLPASNALFGLVGLGSNQGEKGLSDSVQSAIHSYQTNPTAEGFQSIAAQASKLGQFNWADLDKIKYELVNQVGANGRTPGNLEAISALVTGRADMWLNAGADVEPAASDVQMPQRMLAGLGLDLGGQALGLFAGGQQIDTSGYLQASQWLQMAQQNYTQTGHTADASRAQQELTLVNNKIGQICDAQHDIPAAYKRLLEAVSPTVGNAEAAVPVGKFETFVGLVRKEVQDHANDSSPQLKAKLCRDLALLDLVDASYHAQTRLTTADGFSAQQLFVEAQQVLSAAKQLDPKAADQAQIEGLLASLAPDVSQAQRRQQTSPLGAPFGAK